MLQILCDLLSLTPGNQDSLQIVDEAGATVVKGLTQVQVATEEEALALLFEGRQDLKTVRCSFTYLAEPPEPA